MREHEAGRRGSPWRCHPWFKRIFLAVTQVSIATLLDTGAESSVAARKNKSRDEARGDGDKSANDRNRDGNHENARKEERKLERENNDKTGRDGDGDGRINDRGRKQGPQDDDATDVEAATSKKQQANTSQAAEQGNTNPEDTTGGGSRGDGGGNDAGNAGSGFFDSPLATKARRRSNDFDNAGLDEEEDGIFVDVDPEGESVFETDSILLATGPQGVEILTGNITYFAEPPPPPEPLPRLELPVREPGFPFGEDFPFGDAAVNVNPPESQSTDPGNTGPAPVGRADPIPAADEPAPANSDGGDNTMDFSS
jgi:hypothetical protein